jgi:uncharacterized protein (DUF433 family)
MLGKPVFKGTRLPVAFVLQQMGAGTTVEQLLAGYPTLRREHLSAAQLYASDVLEMEDTIFLDRDVA